jgi:hypothetical protein
MFNAGAEQDKEIGLFFRTRGDGSRTFAIPEIQAGQEGLINGTVSMQRDQVRPISVQGRALFIPVVGVNTVYDWGEDQTGQTSKSYIIGQEPKQPADKMGPFRMDVGPRIWRAVGQRQHRLARRV